MLMTFAAKLLLNLHFSKEFTVFTFTVQETLFQCIYITINRFFGIWGNAPITHLNRILKFQKYAARIILDEPPDSPSQPLFEELGNLSHIHGTRTLA